MMILHLIRSRSIVVPLIAREIVFNGFIETVPASNLEIDETSSKSVSKMGKVEKRRREGRKRIEGGKEIKRGNARKRRRWAKHCSAVHISLSVRCSKKLSVYEV